MKNKSSSVAIPMALGIPFGQDGVDGESSAEIFEQPSAETTFYALLFLGAKGWAAAVELSDVEARAEGMVNRPGLELDAYWRCEVRTPIGHFSTLHPGVEDGAARRPPSIAGLIDDMTCEAGMLEMESCDDLSSPSSSPDDSRLGISPRLALIERWERSSEALLAAFGPLREANYSGSCMLRSAEMLCDANPDLALPGIDKPFGLLDLALGLGDDESFARILSCSANDGSLNASRSRKAALFMAELGVGRDEANLAARAAAMEAADIAISSKAVASKKRRASL